MQGDRVADAQVTQWLAWDAWLPAHELPISRNASISQSLSESVMTRVQTALSTFASTGEARLAFSGHEKLAVPSRYLAIGQRHRCSLSLSGFDDVFHLGLKISDRRMHASEISVVLFRNLHAVTLSQFHYDIQEVHAVEFQLIAESLLIIEAIKFLVRGNVFEDIKNFVANFCRGHRSNGSGKLFDSRLAVVGRSLDCRFKCFEVSYCDSWSLPPCNRSKAFPRLNAANDDN